MCNAVVSWIELSVEERGLCCVFECMLARLCNYGIFLMMILVWLYDEENTCNQEHKK